MKYTILIFLIILTSGSILFSQNTIDRVLNEIEKNNTELQALRKISDAQKLGNKTGIYLQNPEAEFNYLWGNPSRIGNRTDFSIKQTFDFPTAYVHKNKISNLMNEQADLEYQKQLRSIMLETKLVCLDLIYTNAISLEYARRLEHARTIAASYKSKFDIGETNILEFNKANLNLLNSEKELEQAGIERNKLLSELARLNGGQNVSFSDSVFDASLIPDDFDKWFLEAEKNNPVLTWLKKEVEISQKQIALNRAMSFPKFQAGYMSESVVSERFRGISAGISIPLWENRNKIKYAMANSSALESIVSDNKVQFYSRLKALHAKASASQKSVNDYRMNLIALDNSDLLRKALDYGEVTLIDYMLELSIYYQSMNRLLQLERELNKSVAELNQFTGI